MFPYAERPSPYPEEQLHKKEKRSQQPTSLVTIKAQVSVFGHGKDRMKKLAGFIGDADDAMVNRLFGTMIACSMQWNSIGTLAPGLLGSLILAIKFLPSQSI